MADLVFPDRPALPPHEPVPVVRVVSHDALAAIREVLSISIHDLVNGSSCKHLVRDLYRITRRIDNEAWLRRRGEEQEREAWIAAHL
jgi:hypothetical protein